MADYGKSALDRGLKVIIAGAGGAAHLPGMLASHTIVPVIGVPIPTAHLGGMDSLYSIVQMPSGVPVATVAIGGGRNAGILAAEIIATFDCDVRDKLRAFKAELAEQSRAKNPLPSVS
jgi:5-(carboxyamino)imidazole ribonucleotide mutase